MGCKVWKGCSYIYKGERLHAIRAQKLGGKKSEIQLPSAYAFPKEIHWSAKHFVQIHLARLHVHTVRTRFLLPMAEQWCCWCRNEWDFCADNFFMRVNFVRLRRPLCSDTRRVPYWRTKIQAFSLLHSTVYSTSVYKGQNMICKAVTVQRPIPWHKQIVCMCI